MWRVLLLCAVQLTLGCIREPREEHSTALRSPGDNGFRIQISGEPERYLPGAVYTCEYNTAMMFIKKYGE